MTMHTSLPLSLWIVPVLLIVMCIPMILGKVPRNRLYGFRTPYTLSSDEIWYRANKITGIAVALSGVFWLAVSWLLPERMGAAGIQWAQLLGPVSLGLAIAVSAWLIYKK